MGEFILNVALALLIIIVLLIVFGLAAGMFLLIALEYDKGQKQIEKTQKWLDEQRRHTHTPN